MSRGRLVFSLAVIGLLFSQAAAAPFLFGLEHVVSRMALRDPAVPTFPTQFTAEVDLTVATEQGQQAASGHMVIDIPNKRLHTVLSFPGYAIETVQHDDTAYGYFMGQCQVTKSAPVSDSDLNNLLKLSTFAGYEDVRGVKCQKFTATVSETVNTLYFTDADQSPVRFTIAMNGKLVQTMDVKSLVVGVAADTEFVVPAAWNCPSSFQFNRLSGLHQLVSLHPATQPARLRDPTVPTLPTQFVAEFQVSVTTPQPMSGPAHMAVDVPNQRQHMVMNFGPFSQATVQRDGKGYSYFGGQCIVFPGASIDDPNTMLKASKFVGFEDVAGGKCQKFTFAVEASNVTMSFFFKDADQTLVRIVSEENGQVVQTMDLTSITFGAPSDSEFEVPAEWHCQP